MIALLIAISGIAPSTRVGAAEPGDTKLGQFIPTSPPQPAPAISFTDLAGNAVALADFKGKVVLVNLWATWCRPCLREMPSLEALQTRLGSALTVVAISEDRGGAKTVEPFIAKLGLDKVAVYLDPRSAATRAFAVRGLPTSLLIDGEGRLVGRVEGAAEWDSAEMRAALKPFLPLPDNAPDGKGTRDAARRASR